MLTTLLRPRQARIVGPQRYGADPMRGVSAVLAGLPNTGGVRINEDSALTLSVVWSCVRLISGSIMSMPFEVRRDLPQGGNERVDNAPARLLLHHRANPYLSGAQFRELMQAWALTWGAGYAEIELDRNLNPVGLWPIGPDRVEPKMLSAREKVYLVDGQIPVPADRMFVLQGLSWDGLKGYSVIQMAARTLGIATAAERHTSQLFANNAQPGMVMTIPESLKPDEREDLRQRLEKRYSQTNNGAWRPIVADGGAKIEPFGFPSKDAQLIESRQFSIVDGCRWFGVAPFMVGHLEGAAYNNVEQQMLQYEQALLPWARRWEDETDAKLLGEADSDPEDDRRAYSHLNLMGLLRADAKTRAEFYERMARLGAININEIRAREDMNPIENGDMHLIPVNNMAPLDTVRPMADAELEAKKNGSGQQAAGSVPPPAPPSPAPPAPNRGSGGPRSESPAQIAERHTLALHEIAVDAFAGLEKVCQNIRAKAKSPAEARDAILARTEKHREALRPVAFSAVRAACLALGGAGVEAIDRLTAQAVELHADRFTFALASGPDSPIAPARASDLLSSVAATAAAEIVKETEPCSAN